MPQIPVKRMQEGGYYMMYCWLTDIYLQFTGVVERYTRKWVKNMLTKRLNENCLENFFSVIRGKDGFRDSPEPQQFRATFRHVIGNKFQANQEIMKLMQAKYL